MVTQELHNTIDLSAPVVQILIIYERDIALNTGEKAAHEVARADFPSPISIARGRASVNALPKRSSTLRWQWVTNGNEGSFATHNAGAVGVSC